MSRVLVTLAPGFEEIEAITVIDLLRRGGLEVIVASLDGAAVTGSHAIQVTPDMDLDAALELEMDMVVLPGGLPGADNLEADSRVIELLRRMADSERFTAAICAAPKVLAAAGVLDGKRATSYPGFLDEGNTPGLRLENRPVVRDGKVITSRGAGTAMDFALTLIESLKGSSKRDEVERALQRPVSS